jgi:hypothetical protein
MSSQSGAIALRTLDGDISGTRREQPASDNRLLADHERLDLETRGHGRVILVQAGGTAQLGNVQAAGGTAPLRPDQIAVSGPVRRSRNCRRGSRIDPR